MRARALVLAVVTTVLLWGWALPGHAAVSLDRVELDGGTLRVEGRDAAAGAAITVDGVARGSADSRGRFDLRVSGFSSPTCRVSVDDGTGAVEATVSGCTPSQPPPEPQPEPEPEPPTPTSLTLSPSSVTSGATASATVLLSGPAPAGGTSVALASSAPAVAAVPASVAVAAGDTSVTATVSTGDLTATSTATITATAGGAGRTATLTVTPAAPSVQLASFTVTPDTVTAGSTADGVLTLTGPAPSGGATVSLFSSNTGIARVPASATVPAGETTAAVTVTALNASTQSATIFASYGVTLSATLTVTAPPPTGSTLDSLTLEPGTVTGGTTSAGTVTFTAPVGSDTAVALTSSDPAVATVPASVTVPAGATAAGFPVTTQPVSGSGTFSVVTATAGGLSRSASLSVNPAAPPSAPAIASVTFAPGSVEGSHPATGTVTLDAVAADGAVVDLASSAPALVQVPAEVVVPAGAASIAFPVTTAETASDSTATVTATARCCGARGTVSGTLPVARTTSPPVADTVRIDDVRWRRCIFEIEATGSNPDAILSVHLTSSGSEVLRLTNLGGGSYAGERAWRAPGNDVPVDIDLRSNLGGSVTTTVADPEAGACRGGL